VLYARCAVPSIADGVVFGAVWDTDGRGGARGDGVGAENAGAEPVVFGSFQRPGACAAVAGAGVSHWFYAGFHEIHNTGKGGQESAEEVWPTIDQWLKNNVDGDPRDNWFLHVNFWDAHTPYRVPMEYGDPFRDAPLPAHLEDEQMIARHVRKTGPHSALDPGMFSDANAAKYPREVAQIKDLASLRHWINGYDTGIKYVDDYVGKIVGRLKAAGIYDDTAIIISSDHGENQAELGIYGEHGTADVATCRIPMIIRWPGAKATPGSTDDEFRYNVDLAPTLMDLLGGRRQPLWDGQSFAHLLAGGARPAPREDIVISQCAHVCQRGVRWADYLYIRTYHDGFHLFPQEMVFDLKADPFEQNDIAPQRPDLCREGAWRLARWHDQQMQKMARTTSEVEDPMWTVIHEGGPFHALPDRLPKYLERLEATNRADGARALREKYGHVLPAV
jgi:choline-sulfatase